MTHDTRFALRFQNDPTYLRAAVVYDFIPLDWPGYLPTLASRISYIAKIARLRNFNAFFPISEYTAWRLSELLGISLDYIHVTGASVRRHFYERRSVAKQSSVQNGATEPYFVVLSGPDSRKNPDVVVKAVRRLNLLLSRRISLTVVGHYGQSNESYKRKLLHLAGHAEGDGFLQFRPSVSDEELVSLYTGATATIVPSHIEGFSLPVVEAATCGCPVLASSCAAHRELIEQPEALFQSDDVVTLADKLEALLADPHAGASIAAGQAPLAAKFHEEAVGERFWGGIEASASNRPYTIRSRRPRFAFLTPFPPDQTSAAIYTANAVCANEQLFRSDIYTDTPRPLTFDGSFRDAGGVSLAPLLDGHYNGVISVLGDSPFHTRILEFFERYGGPCILHDGGSIQGCLGRSGQDQFLKVAAKLLGRPVSIEEVRHRSGDDLLSLLLGPLFQRASPLIVHTVTQQEEIKRRFGVDSQVLTCCPTHFFSDIELTANRRNAARERLGLDPGAFIVSSFESVSSEIGRRAGILAIELMRSWNIPAELYFVGDIGLEEKELDRITSLYGIETHVHSGSYPFDDTSYRDFLIASDASLQLQPCRLDQLPIDLCNCISAGVPSVTTVNLAKSCDAPECVLTVPNNVSPLLIAEQLALIWENDTRRAAHANARAAYLEKHNFNYYGKRLIDILG